MGPASIRASVLRITQHSIKLHCTTLAEAEEHKDLEVHACGDPPGRTHSLRARPYTLVTCQAEERQVQPLRALPMVSVFARVFFTVSDKLAPRQDDGSQEIPAKSQHPKISPSTSRTEAGRWQPKVRPT